MMTKRIREVLRSPQASTWLQSAILSAQERDCVDAARDAAVLADLMAERRDQILWLHKNLPTSIETLGD